MALVKMHRQIIFGKENPEVLQRQVEEQEKEIAAIQKKLDDKQNKLSEADCKLEKQHEEMTAIQARTEELREEAYKYSDTIRKGADTILKNVLLEDMVNEFSERVALLSGEEKNLFDGSLLDSFAENGTDVMHCATLLFLGLVDDAKLLAAHRKALIEAEMKLI
ncbi:MAG: hypothetical protein LUC49_04850 [Prevotella sp.]|nr:hypothetical protein [Prevotella sp.]